MEAPKLLRFQCSCARSHKKKKGIDAIKVDYQKNSLYFTLFNVTHKENPAQISVFNFSSVKKKKCVWQNETDEIAWAHLKKERAGVEIRCLKGAFKATPAAGINNSINSTSYSFYLPSVISTY